MRKRNILFPVAAVLIALVGAFASPLLVQTGWYDSNGASAGGGMLSNITTPVGDTPVCGATGSNICKIFVSPINHDAYNTKQNAESRNPEGLLRYTPQ